MNGRMFVVAGVFGSLLASSAFAQEGGQSPAVTSKVSARAQFELLPAGSGKTTIRGIGDDSSSTRDAAVAYGVTAMFDYAVTPYLSIGVAPRLVLNVKPERMAGEMDTDATKEIDLRARIVGHAPVMPGLEAYASLSPGYAIVTSETDGVDATKGFAIAGAAGVTYDLTPRMFLGAEVGYQRAFVNSEFSLAGQKIEAEGELSYMHIGVGAGTRF